MIKLPEGLTFEQYIQKTSEEQRIAQERAYIKTVLSGEVCEKVKGMKSNVNVIAFSEGYCPDCIVTLPFLKKMEELNSNIKVRILPMKGNEEMLKEFVGTTRIPTVLAFDSNMEPKGAYVEFPQVLSEMMVKLNIEERKELIKEYREGKYNHLIEEQLSNIIL